MKTIAYILLLFFTITIYRCTESLGQKQAKIKTVPEFDGLLMDSATKFKIGSLPSEKNIILFFFLTDCDYCKQLTRQILLNSNTFKKTTIVFISPSPFEQIKNFYYNYELNKFPNYVVAQDYSLSFPKYFNVDGVPYLAIYSKDKTLKKILVGNTNINTLKKAIE